MRRHFISVFLAASLVASAVAQDGQFRPAGAPYPADPQGQPDQSQPYQPQSYQTSPYPAPSGQADDGAEDRDHGVARISVVQGDVNVRRGDNSQLTAAVMNAPLMTRDHLQTSPGSRAEAQLDSANFVRLAPNTDVGFANLAYHRYQAQLGIGTVVLRVIRDSAAQMEIDTPSVTLRPLGQGEYRISVFDNGTSQVTVRSGRLEMYGPNGSQTVDPGHTLLVRGDATGPEFQSASEVARDQLDEWSASRDNELLSSQSYRYVSQDIGGAEDLDANGSWVPSQYGQVWTPQSVPAGWSPYSDGQWSYENYYGWTWIDNAAWGWAPYHYGRWFVNSGRWCWWPGARGSSFYWSPALVGFFGFGRGGLGWVALAPFERGFSWWGRGYGRGYGFGDFAVNRYRNVGFRGGAMTAAFGGFGGPNQRFTAATRAQLTGASLFRGQLPVLPGQGAYRFSNRPAAANPRVAGAASREFFSQRTGARPTNNLRLATPGAVPNARTGGGWQRFGAPSNSGNVRSQGFAPSGSESSGWHVFGKPQPAPSYRGNYSAPQQQRSYQSGQSQSGQRQSGQSYQRFSAPAPHYNAPSPHYSAPAQQHYNAPHGNSGGGGSRGGGGGGSSHGGGGGGHRGR